MAFDAYFSMYAVGNTVASLTSLPAMRAADASGGGIRGV